MFDEILNRLWALDWKEDVPAKYTWTFYKKGWVCKLDWYYGTVTFYRPNLKR